MARHPRILSLAAAHPPYRFPQEVLARAAQERLLGPSWSSHSALLEQGRQIEKLFQATRVAERQAVVDLLTYYDRTPTTGQRMADYEQYALPLARAAFEAGLTRAERVRRATDITDLVVVSCTGYSAPGVDIQLARACELPRDVRRVVVGHMGCFGALAGLRQCLASVRAYPGATAALVSVELASLHYAPTLDLEVLTSFALFGDAAAALLLSDAPEADGPEVVDAYCSADFGAAEQMSWRITDAGFQMGLSPRIPVTLRRNVAAVVERLLTPHGLTVPDVAHWIVHPGGPSILDAIAGKLELSEEQMATSWRVLREHGNCSSATVLLILDELLRSGRPQSGEFGVMMAFGPGLTLETCLLRF